MRKIRCKKCNTLLDGHFSINFVDWFDNFKCEECEIDAGGKDAS